MKKITVLFILALLLGGCLPAGLTRLKTYDLPIQANQEAVLIPKEVIGDNLLLRATIYPYEMTQYRWSLEPGIVAKPEKGYNLCPKQHPWLYLTDICWDPAQPIYFSADENLSLHCELEFSPISEGKGVK